MAESKTLIHIANRKASFEYQILEKFVAGIQLSGTEIKSIRTGNANLNDAYCAFERNELYILNLHISPFERSSYNSHEPKRNRKLLMKSAELKKLFSRVSEKGFAIVPLKIFLSETGYAKVEIALGRGKKSFDKRDDIKQRDAEREMGRYTA
jgi:SsrA-binding protein